MCGAAMGTAGKVGGGGAACNATSDAADGATGVADLQHVGPCFMTTACVVNIETRRTPPVFFFSFVRHPKVICATALPAAHFEWSVGLRKR